MKILHSAFFILPLLLALSGCVTRPQNLETKAYAITRLVVHKVLQAHPEYRTGMEIARVDLQLLAASETVGLEELLEIVLRLPLAQLQDGDTALYVETGILFFSDDLGALAVKNPEQVRLAAAGMARALERVLK